MPPREALRKRRKKWPHYAEYARMDALGISAGVRHKLRQAREMIIAGKNPAVIVGLLADCASALRDLEDNLKEVAPDRGDGNDQ